MRKILNAPTALMDLWIFVGIGSLTVLQTQFGTDDAGRYIPLVILFWLKTANSSVLGGLLAAKMYRSTGFADHLKKKDETQFLQTNRPAP